MALCRLFAEILEFPPSPEACFSLWLAEYDRQGA
jgi:hypothetical protein